MNTGILPELLPAVSGVPNDAPVTPAPATPTPVDELCERFHSLCANAVDALEIAAGLEADGLSDKVALNRYGFRDVFALAEELDRRVPRSPAEPDALPDPWRIRPSRHLLHGLLFGLPALCYPAAAPLLTGPAPLTALVVSMLVSWMLSQGLSYLGHVRLGRLDGGGAARVLRGGMAASVLTLSLVLGTVALTLPVRTPALLFAAGQGTYLLAATVLLVLGADLWLLAALVPGVLAGTADLLVGDAGSSPLVVWCALGLSVLLTVVLAAARTARPAPANGGLLNRPDLLAAVPYATTGLLVAGLLAFPVVSDVMVHDGLDMGLAALPLSLSMGAAEWNLYWYRQQVHNLLRSTRLLADFAAGSRRLLSLALLRYLIVAAGLEVVVAAVAWGVGFQQPGWTDLGAYLAYLVLGGALFLALLLQAFGIGAPVLLACGTGLLVEVVLVLGRHWAGWAVDLVIVQLVVCCGLWIVLLVRAASVLSSAVRHR